MRGSDHESRTIVKSIGQDERRSILAKVLPNRIVSTRKPKLGQNFLVDLDAMQRIVDALGEISQKSVIEIGPGEAALTELLAKRAGRLKDFLKDYKKVAIAAQVETDYYAALSESNQQFLYAIVFVTAVMAIGGIFGVMNTVFAAISQRVKDIGVLGLLGYSRGHILISFLLESLLLALTGGLLGCALGAMSHGLTATSFVTGSSGAGRSVVLKLAVDSQVLSSGILLSLGMGAIGGIIPPLLRAIRLKPLEALR